MATRASGWCWRCLHQRPQQGRIQTENASPTQASITRRKKRPQPGGPGCAPSRGTTAGPCRTAAVGLGPSPWAPCWGSGRAAPRAWLGAPAATGGCSPAMGLGALEAVSGTRGGPGTGSQASAFPTAHAFVQRQCNYSAWCQRAELPPSPTPGVPGWERPSAVPAPQNHHGPAGTSPHVAPRR